MYRSLGLIFSVCFSKSFNKLIPASFSGYPQLETKLSINSSQIYIKKSKDDLMKILDLEANIIKSKKVIEYSSKALSEVELEK